VAAVAVLVVVMGRAAPVVMVFVVPARAAHVVAAAVAADVADAVGAAEPAAATEPAAAAAAAEAVMVVAAAVAAAATAAEPATEVAAVAVNALEALFKDGVVLQETQPESIACLEIVRRLSAALLDPATSEQIKQEGRSTLFEKIGGLTILGHHHPKSVHSIPHDHGRTWAIYGQVSGRTAMYEYEIVTPPQKGKLGTVKLVKRYWILPGQAFWYPTGAIHSHQTHGDSKLIRIEGFNLWRKELKPGGRRFLWTEE
jgi:hypothetical protein